MFFNHDSRGGGGGGPSRLVSYCLQSSSCQIKKHFDNILLIILHKRNVIFCYFKPNKYTCIYMYPRVYIYISCIKTKIS